jgi:hypothetical protein
MRKATYVAEDEVRERDQVAEALAANKRLLPTQRRGFVARIFAMVRRQPK